MTSSSTTTAYPPRSWIPAQQAFDSQPALLRELVPALAGQLRARPVPRPRRLSVFGIGASYAAAASAVYHLRACGVDVARLLPSEWPTDAEIPGDLVILISQSGRSAEIVQLAGGVPPERRFSITNYSPSPLGDLAGNGLVLGNQADSSVSFHSFSGTMLALAMLAQSWVGEVAEARWLAAIDGAEQAGRAAESALAEVAGLMAGRFCVDFVAPAHLASVAEEAALMSREGPRIPATSMETRLYLHGAMDSAGDTTHVVFGGEREALLIDQLAERSSALAFITGKEGTRPRTDAAIVIDLPFGSAEPLEFTLAATFLAQRLTLLAAERNGIDIDAAAFTRLDTKVDRQPVAR